MTMAHRLTSSLSTANRIVQAAGRLFYQNTISAVSMEDIAAEAGLTKMTLYQYFASKEALLLETLKTRYAEREQALEGRLGSGAGAGSERLLQIFDWLEEWLTRNQFNGCAFVNAAVEMGRTWPAVHRVALQSKLSLRSRLGKLVRAAGFRNHASLADGLLLLIEGANTMALLQKSIEPVRHAKRAAQFLLAACK
jgi:AcrR family transcriptional regulator